MNTIDERIFIHAVYGHHLDLCAGIICLNGLVLFFQDDKIGRLSLREKAETNT
jgi:hypothetical protein